VAIVQISRITNRKGLQIDLPQPLAGAELGWAIDDRRLFIGNGELNEGAPVVGNTEILTEFSDVLSLSRYTYQGLAGGYEVQTGPTSGEPISQTITERLDSFAVATDFGITPSASSAYNTTAINRAMFQLYCRDTNPAVRRGLFIPAGEYKICDFLAIPSYATLYGEGSGGTKIIFEVQNWTDTTPWDQSSLVYNEGIYYRALIQVPIGISISDPTYWQSEAMPEYIWRTADSQQNIGINIGINGAIPPTDISIINIEFSTNVLLSDGCLLEDLNSGVLDGVTFTGPMTDSDIIAFATNAVTNASDIEANLTYVIDTLGNTDFTLIGAVSNTIGLSFVATGPGAGTGTAALQHPDTRAIDWASTVSLVSNNVKINNCGFSGFWAGVRTNQQIKSNTVSGCKFDTLYQGVYLGGSSVVAGGPIGTRITQNTFDNVYWNGIYIENCRLNASGYNIFLDVANEFNGYTLPSAPVIDILTSDNVSIGDMFERADDNIVWAHEVRIRINETRSVALEGTDRLLLGTYQRSVGIKENLANVTANAVLFTVDTTFNRAIAIDYSVFDAASGPANVRRGTFTVISSNNGGPSVVFSDQYYENVPVGFSFGASETGNILSITYGTAVSGAMISYSVTKLA
jgi:hypothetical protein